MCVFVQTLARNHEKKWGLFDPDAVDNDLDQSQQELEQGQSYLPEYIFRIIVHISLSVLPIPFALRIHR
jgi:hypothetical protein